MTIEINDHMITTDEIIDCSKCQSAINVDNIENGQTVKPFGALNILKPLEGPVLLNMEKPIEGGIDEQIITILNTSKIFPIVIPNSGNVLLANQQAITLEFNDKITLGYKELTRKWHMISHCVKKRSKNDRKKDR